MCVNKDRQTKGIRHTDRQADRQTEGMCVGGEDLGPGPLTGLIHS